MNKIELELPFIISVRDYHVFEFLEELYQKMFKTKKIKIKEIFSGEFNGYRAVVYFGKMPTTQDIKKLRKVRTDL